MHSAKLLDIFLLDCVEYGARIMRGPNPEICNGLILKGTRALRSAPEARSTGLDNSLTRLLEALPPGEDEARLCDFLEEQYIRLFVADRGGIPAPPYASCHQEGKPRMMGSEALAMAERLHRSGLQVATPGNEPPDHLATQLEYLYFLLHTAWQDDSDPVEDGPAFARSDMLPWVERFAARLEQENESLFYTRVAGFLRQLLMIIAGR